MHGQERGRLFLLLARYIILYNDVSNAAWMSFRKKYIFIHIFMATITLVWFTIGGFNDLKIMLAKLNTDHRDHEDDGWVSD